MSWQGQDKKEMERAELHPFLRSYEFATGSALQEMADGDNPDFVCERPSGRGWAWSSRLLSGIPERSATSVSSAGALVGVRRKR